MSVSKLLRRTVYKYTPIKFNAFLKLKEGKIKKKYMFISNKNKNKVENLYIKYDIVFFK